MKRLQLVALVLIGIAPAACQREAARTADAGGSSPSPAATAASQPAERPPARPRLRPSRSRAPRTCGRPRRAGQLPRRRPLRPPRRPSPLRRRLPTPVPTPTPRPRIVASGTELPIVLQQALSTKTAQPEDPVVAELAADVVVNGDVLLPRGAEVKGHVVSALRSGRVKGRARLVVSFDEVRFDGQGYTIQATGFDVTAGSSKGKDAKIAGGAAAAGVLIGAIAGGGSGAAKGGLIGGAAGGAAVLATRGAEVELASGSSYTIKLQKSLHLR